MKGTISLASPPIFCNTSLTFFNTVYIFLRNWIFHIFWKEHLLLFFSSTAVQLNQLKGVPYLSRRILGVFPRNFTSIPTFVGNVGWSTAALHIEFSFNFIHLVLSNCFWMEVMENVHRCRYTILYIPAVSIFLWVVDFILCFNSNVGSGIINFILAPTQFWI